MTTAETLQLLNEYGLALTEADLAKNAQLKVAVGMSGGVDSSVVATLVKLMGYQTVGLFMKNWEEDNSGACTAEQDWKDARLVADKLDIPIFSVNFAAQYKQSVFDGFVSDYAAGLTPNPDILCNREIKFKVFSDYVKLLGADLLATGHYCQIEQTPEGPVLRKGADPAKDQTYFLHAVPGEALRNVIFPVGHLPKARVRELAARFNLVTSEKKDSTGVCFIGERDFKQFLSQYVSSTQGDFVDLQGKKLGTHDGACFYTLGQRKGLGVGGPGLPWFVAKKDTITNQVTLVQGEDHPALFCDGLLAREASWISKTPIFPRRFRAKVRYRQEDQACSVTEEGGILRVVFDEPQRAVAPGQSVVFYDGDVCWGGAVITEPSPSYHDLGKSLPVAGIV